VIHIRKEQDKSMNRDEGSYQLLHIYKELLAAATSSGKQLFPGMQAEMSIYD